MNYGLSLLVGLLMANSAMMESTPSPEKARLIAEFLVLTGTQKQIDSGRAVETFAVNDGFAVLKANTGADGLYYGELTAGPRGMVSEAYKRAYAKHQQAFQRAYEDHVNWEFTEKELWEINSFLKTPVGQHLREGEWRMNAYTTTNTEHLVLRIAEEAKKTAKADLAAKGYKISPELELTYAQMSEGLPDE